MIPMLENRLVHFDHHHLERQSVRHLPAIGQTGLPRFDQRVAYDEAPAIVEPCQELRSIHRRWHHCWHHQYRLFRIDDRRRRNKFHQSMAEYCRPHSLRVLESKFRPDCGLPVPMRKQPFGRPLFWKPPISWLFVWWFLKLNLMPLLELSHRLLKVSAFTPC